MEIYRQANTNTLNKKKQIGKGKAQKEKNMRDGMR